MHGVVETLLYRPAGHTRQLDAPTTTGNRPSLTSLYQLPELFNIDDNNSPDEKSDDKLLCVVAIHPAGQTEHATVDALLY